MSERFQVVSECAHVLVKDVSGVKATHLLYKGAFLPDEVDADRLKFLVDGGFVAPAGEVPIAANASVKQDPGRGADSVSEALLRGASDAEVEAARLAEAESAAEAKAAAEVDAKRAEAQAKLAEIGTPDGRSSQAVWVEFLVGRGQSYDDVKDVSKAELQKLAEQQSR